MSLPESLTTGLKALALQTDAQFSLLESGFLISKILRPSAKIDDFRPLVDDLCRNLRNAYKHQLTFHPPLIAKISALQSIMANEMGFYGDEDAFDDLDHMNLFNVLETKCATAVSLSLLFIHCAQQCGWSASALNFPGYSLICIDEGNERKIIDPFHGCVELDAYNLRQLIKVIGGAEAELQPVFYDSISPKTLAMRHINAIKLHFLRCEQMDKALEILEAILCLEPNSATFWRETGLLQARTGQIDAAIQSLQTSITLTSDGDAIRHTRHIIEELESKLPT